MHILLIGSETGSVVENQPRGSRAELFTSRCAPYSKGRPRASLTDRSTAAAEQIIQDLKEQQFDL